MTIGILGTGVLAVLFLAVSYLASLPLLPEAPSRIRVCATGSIFFALYALVFYGLMAAATFTPSSILLAGLFFGIIGALFARRDGTWRGVAGADWNALVDLWEFSTDGWRRWLTFGLAVALTVYLLRALVIPPLAWDSLTYHLVRAALWVKAAGLSSYVAPGSWPNYAHLMPLGDALSAGAMVLPKSDILVPLPWLGVWCLFVAATYAAARELGASLESSWLAALAAGFVPAVSAAIFVAYVDNLVAALVVSAIALFARGEKERRLDALCLGIGSLAVACAVKKTGIPFFGMGTLLFGVLLLRDHRDRCLPATLWYLALRLVLIGPPTIYLWVTEGSPLYPWGIRIGDFVFFEGRHRPPDPAASTQEFRYPARLLVEQLLYRGYDGYALSHINFGPFGPIWLALGAWGFVRLVREESPTIWTVTSFGVASFFMVYQVVVHPGLSATNIARYSGAAPALLLATAATLPARVVPWLMKAGLLVELIYWAPTNWSTTGLLATAQFAVLASPFLAASALVLYWAIGRESRTFGWALAAAGALGISALATVLEPIRALHRYDIYAEAAEGNAYANTPVTGNHARSFSSAKLWKHVDDPGSSNEIAVTVGWDGRGVNWFVYPFLGRRLQNNIDYVPVTPDGSIIPLRVKRHRLDEADAQSWYRRLEKRGIDYVAALSPPSIETQVMRDSSTFQLVARDSGGNNLLYRLRMLHTSSSR